MDPWAGAVTEEGDGVGILLEVSPGSRRGASVTGYNPWRRRVQCTVSAPPRGGKANRDVVELMADVLSVPASAVTLSAGAASREKRIHVQNLMEDEALARLHTAAESHSSRS
ncbi:MAG: DUF167 domain-containing protein [Methanomicrobiales archaeon]|nr:DUF167 domain-containing protein [Methanomicrobiales archaeon]